MIVTIDTNVIFSGLYSKTGASYFILNLVLEEKIKAAISTQTYFEYYDVLTRLQNLEKMNLTVQDVEDFLDYFTKLAQKHSIYFLLRPNLPDEEDNKFVECAFASNSTYIITSNVRDFNKSELKKLGYGYVTPSQFYDLWREHDE